MIRFTFLKDKKNLQAAKETFKQLKVTCPKDEDNFFELYGPGNTPFVTDRPYERFEDYELLLETLQGDDRLKYEKIHKGTPFYFLAWTAFDLKNYEKAVFYMDAAISEDMRKNPQGWLNNPASQFLTLNVQGDQTAIRITKHLTDKISTELSRFNKISSLPPLSIKFFVEKFVKELAKDKKHHSIITAFYSFILEFEDREKELSLRSTAGGSIEPTLTYLFKGGLIFESLLKYLYPKKDNGIDECKTLGNIFNTKTFRADFNVAIQTSANTLQEIVNNIKDDLQSAFNTTSKIRNTAGHNLVWDDVFNSSTNFKGLYEQQVNAILYLIQKKF